MESNVSSYDAIVIGGGPAGTTAATVIAQQGHKVLLLDRDHLPRFHIGESLMPATYWSLERLNMLDKMHAADFVEKRSVQFVSVNGKTSAPFYFHEFDDHESSQTWQVVRSKFDKLLWDNAAEHGAEVREATNVKEVLFEEGRAVGVRVENADGSREEIRARAVVDASGQSSMIVRKFGLREVDPVLRHAAYFTRFRGAKREPGIDGGATLVLHTSTGINWFWYIPQPDDVISIGVVGPTAVLKGLGDSPQAVFDAEVANCPALQERIEGAEQLEPIQVQRDFSYISRRIAGDGWVLAGDAFGFLDPVYSTGAFLAMKSGELAGDAVSEGLEQNDLSAARLGRHGDEYLAGMEAMRKLVYAYYDPDFAIPHFVKEHPHCREAIVNLLVGNVFRRPVGDLFELMGKYTKLPETRRLEPVEQPS